MANLEHTQHAVNLKRVSKVNPGTPPVIALSDVTLTVKHGELLGIVGASGSGKSTLLHIAGLLDEADEGSVTLAGTDVSGQSDRRRRRVRLFIQAARPCGVSRRRQLRPVGPVAERSAGGVGGGA